MHTGLEQKEFQIRVLQGALMFISGIDLDTTRVVTRQITFITLEMFLEV
jgi:hypothetical protein